MELPASERSPVAGTSGAWRSFSDWCLNRRRGVLFLSLLLTLVLAPVLQEYHQRRGAVELLYLMILGAAAFTLDGPRSRIWAFAAVALTAVLRILGRSSDLPVAAEIAAALFVGLAILTGVNSLRFALTGQNVTSERIGAALSTYLLAGQVFGVCYWQVEQLHTGSFAMGGAVPPAGALDLPTSVYFSFVTLATLGYGDIVPVGPTARGLAVTEAILGQLYLAVLVARLVGARTK